MRVLGILIILSVFGTLAYVCYWNTRSWRFAIGLFFGLPLAIALIFLAMNMIFGCAGCD